MRCTTAARAKAKHLKYRGAPLHDYPREGSRLRKNCDLLQANKGLPTPLIGSPINIVNDLRQLTDFYGMDIRQIDRRGHRGSTDAQYVLAGEWFGRVYIDYIADHIKGAAQ